MSAVQQAIGEILIDSEKIKGRKMMDNEKVFNHDENWRERNERFCFQGFR